MTRVPPPHDTARRAAGAAFALVTQLALLTPRDVPIAAELGELTAPDLTQGARFVELGEKAAMRRPARTAT